MVVRRPVTRVAAAVVALVLSAHVVVVTEAAGHLRRQQTPPHMPGPVSCGLNPLVQKQRSCVEELLAFVGPTSDPPVTFNAGAPLHPPHPLQQKVKANLAHRPAPLIASPPAPSYSVRAIDFGADPTGESDSSSALQKMLDTVWATNKSSLPTGEPDLQGLTFDLTGGHYRLDTPLHLPAAAGGNAVIANGALFAGDDFPPESHLLQMDLINITSHFFRYRFMVFQNLEFDARHVAAGGLLIRQAEETRVDLCFFRGYRQSGILSELVGNELFVQNSWFMELDDYTQCHNVSAKTGTGVVLDNNDHSLDNIVIYCSNRGLVLSGAATVVRNLHVYIEGDELYPSGAALVNATSIRLDSCYFDGCPVFVDNAGDVQIANSFFLLIEGDQANSGAVIVSPPTDNYVMAGFQVIDNILGGAPRSSGYPFVRLNETVHALDHANVLDTVVARNAFNPWQVQHSHLQPTTTQLHVSVSVPADAAPTSNVTFDLRSDLLFAPTVTPYTQVTVAHANNATEATLFTRHALVQAAPNVFDVRFETPVAGVTVSLAVDQSRPLL